jgi:hypothetical protein
LKMCLKMVVIQKNFVLNLDQNLMVGKKSENQKMKQYPFEVQI